MRFFFVKAVVLVSTVASCDAASTTTNPSQSRLRLTDASPWSETNRSGGKRFLRLAEAKIDDNKSTGYTTNTKSRATSHKEEERDFTLASSVTKLMQKTKNVLSGAPINKVAMTPAKLRVKFLENMPLDVAANAMFVGKNSPKVHWKMHGTIKPYPFKISGPVAIVLRVKMRDWLSYGFPPTYVYKKLGIKVPKGIGKKVSDHPNYQYFKWYFDKWYELEKPVQLKFL